MFIKKTYDLNIQINKQKLSPWKITLNINRKINGTWIIKKLRYYVQEETLFNFYDAFVKSHIDCEILAWGSANKTNKNHRKNN